VATSFSLSRKWKHRDAVLASCTAALFATMVARVSFSPLVPAITATYGISNTLMGLVLSGMWLTYGLVQYPSGILAGRYGERSIILIAVGGTVIMCLLVALAPVFTVFAVGVLLLGGIAGMHYSVATALLSRSYENGGTAIGVHHLGGAGGGLFGPIAATWILIQYGWRWAIVASAVVATGAFILVFWYVNSSSQSQAVGNAFSISFIIDTFSQRSIGFLVVVLVSFLFVAQGIISFLPAFLVEYRGISATLAGTLFAVFFVTHAIFQTIAGAVSDRTGVPATTVSCIVVTIVGLTLLIHGFSMFYIIIGSVLVGAGTAGMTVVITGIMNFLPSDRRKTRFGLTQTFTMSIGSLGPVVVGFVADRFGWAISFQLLIIIMSIALTIYIIKYLINQKTIN